METIMKGIATFLLFFILIGMGPIGWIILLFYAAALFKD